MIEKTEVSVKRESLTPEDVELASRLFLFGRILELTKVVLELSEERISRNFERVQGLLIEEEKKFLLNRVGDSARTPRDKMIAASLSVSGLMSRIVEGTGVEKSFELTETGKWFVSNLKKIETLEGH
jgi:hypothetical protein